MDLQLAGKRAVVTGGSRGIGRAIAQALAAEGCAVGLIARGEAGLRATAAELEGAGARVAWAAADVTDATSHDRALRKLVEELGGVEIAVANAGGSAPGGALEASDELWRSQWELNFLSAARLLRGCKPHMERAGYGSALVISSISGLEAFGRPAYVAPKAALHGLVKSAALEGAPLGIRVNAIAPGSILFPGGSWDRRRSDSPEAFRQVEESIPFGRLGTPEEVAHVAAFLASPRASWVSGEVVVVDGCQTRRF